MSENLYKNWKTVKEILLDGLDEERKQVLDVLLDNTRRKTDPKMAKLILPILRKIIETNLFEIIGIQAMPHCFDKVEISWKDHENYFETIEAKRRKLGAAYHLYNEEEIKEGYAKGIDVEAETMACMAQEIIAEIELEIISRYKSSTPVYLEYNKENPEKNIISKISEMINEITSDNKWIIISPDILVVLSKSEKFEKYEKKCYGSLGYVGKFENAKVFINQYACHFYPHNEPVIFGYKNSNIDAPAIYAPYVMIDIIQEKDKCTFEEICRSYTRYGFIDNGIKDKIKLLTIDFGPRLMPSNF